MSKLTVCDICEDLGTVTKAQWTVTEVLGKRKGGRPTYGSPNEVCSEHVTNAVATMVAVETDSDESGDFGPPSDLRYIEVKPIA